MRFFIVLLACLTLLPFNVRADDNDGAQPKAGQTILNISATERQSVPQDLLLANLRYEADRKDPKELQNEINTLMKASLEKAKAYDKVEVSTDNYYVYQYDPNPQPVPVTKGQDPRKNWMWRGSQGLSLKSKDSESLLKLMGELQDLGLQSSGLTYTLSPETFETARDTMMESALKKLMEKAKRAGKALGKDSGELIEVNVDTGYPNPPMPMMARAEMAYAKGAADMAAPVADPGQSEITLTVSAKALLK